MFEGDDGRGTGYDEITSFAISVKVFRRDEIKESTPSGRVKVSEETNVTWTFDN